MTFVPMTHASVTPIPDAVLWAWLQEAVAFAESYFGPRDPTWEIRPGRIAPDGPYTFFPLAAPGHGLFGRVIEVHLGPNAQRYAPSALFQLGHEAVHLLTPRWPERASLLEEGLATWASLAFVRRRQLPADARAWYTPTYAEALALVEPWLGRPEDFPDPAVAGAPVRALRQRAAAVSAATPDDLQAVWPGMDRAAAERLAGSSGVMRYLER